MFVEEKNEKRKGGRDEGKKEIRKKGFEDIDYTQKLRLLLYNKSADRDHFSYL